MRQLLHGPVREHDPGHDGVEEEDEGVGDTGSNTVVSSVNVSTMSIPCIRRAPVPTLSAARTEDGAARRGSAARGSKTPYLKALVYM